MKAKSVIRFSIALLLLAAFFLLCRDAALGVATGDVATNRIDMALSEYVQRRLTNADAAVKNPNIAPESVQLADLEKKHGFSPGVLTNQLPAFGRKLAVDTNAPAYTRAQGAFLATDYAEAERLSLQATTEAKKHQSPDRSKILRCLELASLSVLLRGELVKAISYYQSTAKYADEARDPLEWARVHGDLATAFIVGGKFGLAEPLLRQIAAIRAGKLGSEHADTLFTRHTLANVLSAQGKYAAAEKEFREVCVLYERVYGPEDPETLGNRYNLANTLLALGKLVDAEAEYRAVLKLQEHVNGPDDPRTLDTRNNLATTLEAEKRLPEAESEHRAVLASRLRTAGPDGLELQSSRNNLGNVLSLQRKYSEAEEQHRAAYTTRLRILGGDHPKTLLSQENLATVLAEQGKYAEAVHHLRTVCNKQQRILGPSHPETLRAYHHFSGVLLKSGNRAEAQRYARWAKEGAARSLPPQDSRRKQYERWYEQVGSSTRP